MTTLADATRIHVVGIGGAGMSAVARLLHERGARVTGSDVALSTTIDELGKSGIDVVVGHRVEWVDQSDLTLASPAVGESDSEWRRAHQLGRAMNRSELFGSLSSLGSVVGFCGTHGKTTATSMMVVINALANASSSWLVGADVKGVGYNGHWGGGTLIVEVDESYGTFAQLRPTDLAVLNVDADHLDHYGSIEAIQRAFRGLAERTSGRIVAWGDDDGARRALEGLPRVTWVGTSTSHPWRVGDIDTSRDGSRFTLTNDGEQHSFALATPGRHLVTDAAVVAVMAHFQGRTWPEIATGLSHFAGAPRRFTRRGRYRHCDLIEDYAHLPAEISATLETTVSMGYHSPLVIFQPHRYSRTQSLARDFARAFDDAKVVVVTDIYAAGETPVPGVTGQVIAQAILEGGRPQVHYRASLEEAREWILTRSSEHDVVLALGAGDVASVFADLDRDPE